MNKLSFIIILVVPFIWNLVPSVNAAVRVVGDNSTTNANFCAELTAERANITVIGLYKTRFLAILYDPAYHYNYSIYELPLDRSIDASRRVLHLYNGVPLPGVYQKLNEFLNKWYFISLKLITVDDSTTGGHGYLFLELPEKVALYSFDKEQFYVLTKNITPHKSQMAMVSTIWEATYYGITMEDSGWSIAKFAFNSPNSLINNTQITQTTPTFKMCKVGENSMLVSTENKGCPVPFTSPKVSAAFSDHVQIYLISPESQLVTIFAIAAVETSLNTPVQVYKVDFRKFFICSSPATSISPYISTDSSNSGGKESGGGHAALAVIIIFMVIILIIIGALVVFCCFCHPPSSAQAGGAQAGGGSQSKQTGGGGKLDGDSNKQLPSPYLQHSTSSSNNNNNSSEQQRKSSSVDNVNSSSMDVKNKAPRQMPPKMNNKISMAGGKGIAAPTKAVIAPKVQRLKNSKGGGANSISSKKNKKKKKDNKKRFTSKTSKAAATTTRSINKVSKDNKKTTANKRENSAKLSSRKPNPNNTTSTSRKNKPSTSSKRKTTNKTSRNISKK